MTLSRARLLVAGALTAIGPALTFLWLDLFVSGATFYQGRREWGHVYKHLWTFIVIWPLSLAAALGLGVTVVFLAKRSEPLTASGLFKWAAPVSVLTGLGAWAFVTQWQFSEASFVVAPIIAAYGLLLASVFVIVGGVPLRIGAAAVAPADGLSRFADRAILSVAVLATATGVIVISGATALALTHGCDCG